MANTPALRRDARYGVPEKPLQTNDRLARTRRVIALLVVIFGRRKLCPGAGGSRCGLDPVGVPVSPTPIVPPAVLIAIAITAAAGNDHRGRVAIVGSAITVWPSVVGAVSAIRISIP